MAINPVTAATPFVRPTAIAPPTLEPTGGLPGKAIGGTQGTSAADGTGFADQVMRALEGVERQQQVASGLAQQAATGQLEDVHDYMIAATQAQLATELTVAVRNRALESFNEIMRMQV